MVKIMINKLLIIIIFISLLITNRILMDVEVPNFQEHTIMYVGIS